MIHARATPATAWRLSKTVSAFVGVSNETMVAPEMNNALVLRSPPHAESRNNNTCLFTLIRADDDMRADRGQIAARSRCN